jgi:hypothetical protein
MDLGDKTKDKGKGKELEHEPNKITKFDILLLNHGWNDKNESLIASIGENSELYHLMHLKASKRFNLINRIIGIVIVILNAILSAQTSFDGLEKVSSDLFQKILIYVVTVTSVINNFLRYQETATNHANASHHFSEITHDVQQHMCMYRKDRDNAVKYIQHTMKKYDSIRSSSPDIPDYLLKEFKSKIQNSGLSMPDKMQKIDIAIHQGDEEEGPSSDTNYNLTNYNPLKINGDINDDDCEKLDDYIRKFSNAALQYQFERWKEPT